MKVENPHLLKMRNLNKAAAYAKAYTTSKSVAPKLCCNLCSKVAPSFGVLPHLLSAIFEN